MAAPMPGTCKVTSKTLCRNIARKISLPETTVRTVFNHLVDQMIHEVAHKKNQIVLNDFCIIGLSKPRRKRIIMMNGEKTVVPKHRLLSIAASKLVRGMLKEED